MMRRALLVGGGAALLAGAFAVANVLGNAQRDENRRDAIAAAESKREQATRQVAAEAKASAAAASAESVRRENEAALREADNEERAANEQRCSRVRGMTPWQRMTAVRAACTSAGECDEREVDLICECSQDAAEGGRLRDLRQSLRSAAINVEKAKAAAAHEASRGLKCCDGSESPTCLCNAAHRGCCSHHGGVCGCMP